MAVLQHYYTSCRNEATGHTGFQVKAISPGITSEMEKTINRLIGYKIPPSLDVWAIETHPIALRYYYESPEQSYLLCSQSCGSDDNGRPGNFFVHTLVLPPDMFIYIPPIFFWKSTFWQHSDTEPRLSLASLPMLPSFDEEPALDPNGVWDFIEREGRRNLLYKLLCAIIHSEKTKRRVVILDTTEHVVWWIAAVSMLLPPAYRPLLSFATYHHDPKQAPFLITGTTSDSSFGVSPTDYQYFFVLNAQTKEAGKVEDSAYAQLATQAAQPDLYDERLLPLFADYARRFPSPTTIGEHLDSIALYAGLCRPRNESILSPGEINAIHLALPSFEALSDYSPQDGEELNALQQVLAQSLRLQRSTAVNTELGRVEALLKRQNVSLDGKFRADERTEPGASVPTGEPCEDRAYQQPGKQAVSYTSGGQQERQTQTTDNKQEAFRAQHQNSDLLKESQARTESSLEDELKQLIDNANGQLRVNPLLIQQLAQHYSPEQLKAAINDRASISWLIASCRQLSSQQLLQLWQAIGSYIQPRGENQQILLQSLRVVARLWNEHRSQEGKALLRAMWQAMKGDETLWLQIAVDNYHSLPEGLVEVFYYSFAGPLELDQRLPYRSVILPVSQIILNYEIVADISSLDARQGLKTLERWVEHAQRNQYQLAPLVMLGITHLRGVCSQREWQELAPVLLRNASLRPLPIDIENELVSITFSSFSLAQLSLADLPLYQRYNDHPAMLPETGVMLSDILSLAKGHLTEMQAQRLNKQMKRLEPEAYRAFVKQCIPYFFDNAPAQKEHFNLINALFTEQGTQIADFWQAYWNAIKKLLSQQSTVSTFTAIFGFWFSASPTNFAIKYVLQDFFLQLSFQLKAIQKDRSFQEGIREFNKVADQRRNTWYPVVQDYFEEKKGVLGTVGAALSALPQLFRGSESQLTDEEAEEERRQRQELATKIGKLFEGKVQDQHSRKLVDLYTVEPKERFWSCYWEALKDAMTSGEAGIVIEVYTFWFDKAFDKLKAVNYLPQEFFIQLPTVLAEARQENERAFQKTVDRLESQARSCAWYPFIRGYQGEGKKWFW